MKLTQDSGKNDVGTIYEDNLQKTSTMLNGESGVYADEDNDIRKKNEAPDTDKRYFTNALNTGTANSDVGEGSIGNSLLKLSTKPSASHMLPSDPVTPAPLKPVELAPSEPTRPVAHVPSNITRDCYTNVSSQLNKWILGQPESVTLDFDGGCFRIDQSLRIEYRNDLIFDGGGATFRSVHQTGTGNTIPIDDSDEAYDARHRAQWYVMGSNNLTFKI